MVQTSILAEANLTARSAVYTSILRQQVSLSARTAVETRILRQQVFTDAVGCVVQTSILPQQERQVVRHVVQVSILRQRDCGTGKYSTVFGASTESKCVQCVETLSVLVPGLLTD